MAADTTMNAPGAGLVQVGVDRAHPSLDHLAASLACGAGALRTAALVAPVVPLVTCHRIELYFEHATVAEAMAAFGAWAGATDSMPPAVRQGPDAARHLFRVASGLESAVLGEDQILSQVRAAYRDACARGAPGALLHRVFHTAFRIGRRVRHETALGAGPRSLAGAAVSALCGRAGGLRGRSAAVVGAGETGALAARLLAERGAAPLWICSRTAARASALAAAVGACVLPWEWRDGLLACADVIVSAVRAEAPVLRAAPAGVRTRTIAIADLGMPPNVARGTHGAVHVIGLPALERGLRADGERRAAAIASAEAIVRQELDAWIGWRRARDVRGPVRAVFA
jgi:glutamyl-tRNA reductase